MAEQRKPSTVKKIHYPFWFGGSASCFAAGVTHPLDLGRFLHHLIMKYVLTSLSVKVNDFEPGRRRA